MFASAVLTVLLLQAPAIFTVQGDSMAPTLLSGDRIAIQPGKEYSRGDIVAVRFKTLPRPMVKRVVAVGGDKVAFEKASMRVNGTLVYFIDPRVARKLAAQLGRGKGRVPHTALIVLGDNPKSSLDSSLFGLVYANQIIGRAMPIYEAR